MKLFNKSQFIILNEGRTQEIDESQLKDYIEQCSDYLTIPKAKRVSLFRGIKRDFKYGVIDPSATERTAMGQNNKDYFGTMLNQLFDSNSIPNRSKSLICSTSVQFAKDFGGVYDVIPFNDAKLTFANTPDYWDQIDKETYIDVSMFNNEFEMWADEFHFRNNKKTQLDYKKEINDIGNKLRIRKLSDMDDGSARNFINDIYLNNGNLYDLMYKKLEGSLKLSNLKILNSNQLTYDNFSSIRSMEVWTESKCLLMGHGLMDFLKL